MASPFVVFDPVIVVVIQIAVNFAFSYRAYTKFYRQFRHSHYYTAEVIRGQDRSFPFFACFVMKKLSIFTVDSETFWVFLIETTLDFAVRVADGSLPGDEENSRPVASAPDARRFRGTKTGGNGQAFERVRAGKGHRCMRL